MKRRRGEQVKNNQKIMKEPGLDNRHRDKIGTIDKKRKDTLVRTLREHYGENFLRGFRADATLGTVLKKKKVDSLSALLKKKKIK
jgi:hypothetical protein